LRALVLIEPDGAFASTVARPMTLACLLVAAAFSLATPVAFAVAAERTGGVEAVVVDGLKRSGRLDKLPPAARAGALERMASASRYVLPLGAVARRLTWIVSIAALAFALLRATRPQARLGVVVACAAVGAAPLFVKDIIAGIALASTADVRGLEATNVVLSNPSAWLYGGAEARAPLAVALRAVDLFELWACAWMAAGIERAVGGRTRLPYVVVASCYALLAALTTAQAALTSAP
jgi:hypothetical protein